MYSLVLINECICHNNYYKDEHLGVLKHPGKLHALNISFFSFLHKLCSNYSLIIHANLIYCQSSKIFIMPHQSDPTHRIRHPIRGKTGFSKSWGEVVASISSSLSFPPPPVLLTSPQFSCNQNVENSSFFACYTGY